MDRFPRLFFHEIDACIYGNRAPSIEVLQASDRGTVSQVGEI